MSIKTRLQKWRKDKDITQTQAAKALGVPIATYRNWEQGRVKPTSGMKTAILKATAALAMIPLVLLGADLSSSNFSTRFGPEVTNIVVLSNHVYLEFGSSIVVPVSEKDWAAISNWFPKSLRTNTISFSIEVTNKTKTK